MKLRRFGCNSERPLVTMPMHYVALPDGADGVLDAPAVPSAVDAESEDPQFPAAAAWDVALAEPGERAEPVEGSIEPEVVAVDQLPVTIAPGTEDASGERLRVEVFDRAAAESAGASGFVFAVDAASDHASVAEIAEGQALPAELSIDYSGFAGAYGGDYVARLQVVACQRAC
ncbi:MAG: hypothetical protein ACRDLA_19575 [Thermoleophilaceae bacterium]